MRGRVPGGHGGSEHGHQVIKFSPEGEVLLVLGTPGETGDPPTHFTEPNDVVVGPDGSIYVGEAHGAQFQDEPGPDAIGRITKWAPDGTFIKSWGAWGYEDGQFRAPHSLAFDSQGRLFVADRGNRRIQIFDQEGTHLVPRWKALGAGCSPAPETGPLREPSANRSHLSADAPCS